MASRIYLDNAATSWPKPEEVYQAVDRYQRNNGAPAGRSGYSEAMEVGRRVENLRRAILQLVGAPEDEYVVAFASSGTDALNMALHGSLGPGDHVVTTQAEHNSVLRPLRWLQRHRQVQVTRVHIADDGWADPEDICRALEPNTRLIALVHASNVTGVVQSLEEVSRIASEHQVMLLVDAAQTLGKWPLDLRRTPVDLLASPGHKGLLGPLGTGLLVIRRSSAQQLVPVRQGGTGSHSESDEQPEFLPDRLEAGNLNVPGLVGLAAGVAWVAEQGVGQIADHERELAEWMATRLSTTRAELYGMRGGRPRVGVLSLNLPGYDPQELAAALDAAATIQVRAGFHCAPLLHRALRTDRLGGTVRLSVGPFNSREQLDRVAEVLEDLAATSLPV